jgi:hypothetical protein
MLNFRPMTTFLVIQIVLAFFCPPIARGERMIFLSDLWLFGWVFVAGIYAFTHSDGKIRRNFLLVLTGIGALFGIAWIHGMARPSMAPSLAPFLIVEKEDQFNPLREAFLAFRFFAWCAAGVIVSQFRLDRVTIERTLAGCTFLAVVAMILGQISPEIRAAFGHFYHYDPEVANWADRAYGVFRSPIEDSVVLCLAFLVLIQGVWAKTRTKIAIAIFIVLGVVLSKTLTAFVAMLIALLYAWLVTMNPKRAKWIVLGFLATTVAVTAAVWETAFMLQKRETFLFRFKPWGVYWDVALSRTDRFLFGNGFHPYFSDSLYVFLFSRGGVLLLGAALYGFVRLWLRPSVGLTPIQKTIPIFFLISGLTVDSLILRPVIYVFLSAGLLTLRNPRSQQYRDDRKPESTIAKKLSRDDKSSSGE